MKKNKNNIMTSQSPIQTPNKSEFSILIGTIFKSFRKGRYKTRESFVNVHHLNRQGIKEIESGRGNPTLYSLFKYCHSLGISLHEFCQKIDAFFLESDPKKTPTDSPNKTHHHIQTPTIFIPQEGPYTAAYHMAIKGASNGYRMIIEGEMGTGKSTLISYIQHTLFPDWKQMIIHCPYLETDPEYLNYIKTHISKQKHSLIILDHIDRLSSKTQTLLYDHLKTTPLQKQTRLICTSQSSLIEQVKQGTFLQALFLYLYEFLVYIPPLSSDQVTTHNYIQYFIETSTHNNPTDSPIPTDIKSYLKNRTWEGNLLEMKQTISLIIPALIKRNKQPLIDILLSLDSSTDLDDKMTLIEKHTIETALYAHQGRLKNTAQSLNISSPNLIQKLKRFKIDKAQFK